MDKEPEQWTIGATARHAGVSVRTLQYYDELGLVSAARLSNGYRIYDAAARSRLAVVLYWRRLGVPVETIRELLSSPESSQRTILSKHRQRLAQERSRIDAAITQLQQALDGATIELPNNVGDLPMSKTRKDKEMESQRQMPDFEREAQERWGDTAAWKESQRRAQKYTQEQWQEMRRQLTEIEAALTNAIQSGESPVGTVAMDLAEGHRLHIDRWFYPCSYQMHQNLAQMYLQDDRFRKHYEDLAPGLADFWVQAIGANAERAATEQAQED